MPRTYIWSRIAQSGGSGALVDDAFSLRTMLDKTNGMTKTSDERSEHHADTSSSSLRNSAGSEIESGSDEGSGLASADIVLEGKASSGYGNVATDMDLITSTGSQYEEMEPVAELSVLCRTLTQIETAADMPAVKLLLADFEFLKQYDAAVAVARAKGKRIGLVTPRIHKPGEQGYLARILRLAPDVILVRNTGALHYYNQAQQEYDATGRAFPQLIGDFSLNIANHKAADLFLCAGLDMLTPSYDLNAAQMIDFLHAMPEPQRAQVVLHQHLPMFHTEHCVYCTFLSEGTNYTNCGRPCEAHHASLQDRIGMSHPVRVDEGCRNTVYNAIEQSGAEYLPTFLELGVQSYRLEFLEESASEVRQVIDLYQSLLQGDITGSDVWRTLKATNQLGVTRGQLVK
jgi:putative protease